jgi:hypothetical protein
MITRGRFSDALRSAAKWESITNHNIVSVGCVVNFIVKNTINQKHLLEISFPLHFYSLEIFENLGYLGNLGFIIQNKKL